MGVEAGKDTQESQPVDFFRYLLEPQHHWLFVKYIIQMGELDGTRDTELKEMVPGPLSIYKVHMLLRTLRVREEASSGIAAHEEARQTCVCCICKRTYEEAKKKNGMS